MKNYLVFALFLSCSNKIIQLDIPCEDKKEMNTLIEVSKREGKSACYAVMEGEFDIVKLPIGHMVITCDD